jgi:hypothetical protein
MEAAADWQTETFLEAFMSETAAKPALPLFFSSVVGVNATQHGNLRIKHNTGFGFAAHAQAIPLGLGEFDNAAQHYPIVFAAGPIPVPMVLLGLKPASNLFVMPDGAWRKDSYIPAYPRAFPFVLVEDTEKGTVFVGMEPDAAALSATEGTPMFEDGKPSPMVNEMISLTAAVRENLNAARAFGQALMEAGLLEQEEANISFTKGGSAKVVGFQQIKPERLEKLDDATFLDWRHRGWIAAIYAHLYSTGRWGRLVDLMMQVEPV